MRGQKFVYEAFYSEPVTFTSDVEQTEQRTTTTICLKNNRMNGLSRKNSYKTNQEGAGRTQEHLRKVTRTYKININMQKLYIVTDLRYFALVHRIKAIIVNGTIII